MVGIGVTFTRLLCCIAISFLFMCLCPLYFSDEPQSDAGRDGGERRMARVLMATSTRLSTTAIPSPPIIQQECPEVPNHVLRTLSLSDSGPVSAKQKVLALCGQREPLPLEKLFTDVMVATISKLGEGAFAEVFGCEDDNDKSLALKVHHLYHFIKDMALYHVQVVPIEGDFKFNDGNQSTFDNILPEMIISRELSLLGNKERENNKNWPFFTANFVQIERMALCIGQFPPFLVRAWEEYDSEYKSENDRPDIFPENQLYVVYSTEDAGDPLEDYVFHSFEKAKSVIAQVAGALAIGEEALEFEHRDLHGSNVLVRWTRERYSNIRLDGKDYHIKTHGVRATVVDYTLSRIKQRECVSYNDLNKLPWLFRGKGDIQFDVYRNMKNASNSHWEDFHPSTNVMWLSYLLKKINKRTRLASNADMRSWREQFRPLLREVTRCSSARDAFVKLFAADS